MSPGTVGGGPRWSAGGYPPAATPPADGSRRVEPARHRASSVTERAAAMPVARVLNVTGAPRWSETARAARWRPVSGLGRLRWPSVGFHQNPFDSLDPVEAGNRASMPCRASLTEQSSFCKDRNSCYDRNITVARAMVWEDPRMLDPSGPPAQPAHADISLQRRFFGELERTR